MTNLTLKMEFTDNLKIILDQQNGHSTYILRISLILINSTLHLYSAKVCAILREKSKVRIN